MKLLAVLSVMMLSVPVIRGFAPAAQGGGQTRWGYRVVNTYPHDANAFTQGIVVVDGVLYESTGQLGRSSLRRVDLTTGKVLQKQDVDVKHFAEGLAAWQNSLIQLTWQSNIAFVYDRTTFKQIKTFPVAGEGWGLTQDGKSLILSDGSPVLRFFDPATFKQTHFITVKDGKTPVDQLNELEFVKGEIFANVWHTDRIARINPTTGAITGWIDLAGLLKPGEVRDPEAVLNGIAYDAKADRLFVTGKLWPKIFEIKLERRP